MTLIHGDCIEAMAGMEPESVDAIVTDPPPDDAVPSPKSCVMCSGPDQAGPCFGSGRCFADYMATE